MQVSQGKSRQAALCLHSQTRLRSPLRSRLPTCSFLTLMPTFHLFQEVPAKLGVRACACTHRHTCTLIPCTCQKCESHSVMSNTLRPHGLYSPWNYPGQNTGVGGCSLLQEIFPTLGLKPGLPHCRRFFTGESAGKPAILRSLVHYSAQSVQPCLGPIWSSEGFQSNIFWSWITRSEEMGELLF